MSTWNEILRRAAYLGRRSQFDQELDEEIRFHIETRAEELEAEGIPAKAAYEQARREFGPRARATEDARSAWQIPWLEDLWRDLSYAVRGAVREPGFTAVAVLSLALGVGANCAMFIFVEAILLRPLAIPNPGEVVTVHETTAQSGMSGTSYRDYVDLRDRSRNFSGLGAFVDVNNGFAARSGAVPHTQHGQLVSGNYFEVLGVAPELGRGFLPEEQKVPGRDAVVILSHTLWEREFHSDPDVLNRKIWLGGIAFQVVGVMPAQFASVDEDLTESFAQYYVPLMMAPKICTNPYILEKRDSPDLTVIGRLSSGVTLQQARAEVSTVARNLAKQYQETNRGREMVVQTFVNYRTTGVGGYVGMGIMLLAGAVFLVACANVAGLLSSRAAGRSQEIAVRLTVGASRPRLIRQLLTESSLLAAGGCVAGVALGYIPVLLMQRLAGQFSLSEDDLAHLALFRMDQQVVFFSIAVALISVLVFGLAPAFQTTRTDLSGAMKGNFAVPVRHGVFRDWLWGKNLLVMTQVAISFFLLTISGYVYVGLSRMLDVAKDSGFASDHVLMMAFDPLLERYPDAQARQFYQRLRYRLHSDEGIKSVTLASSAQTIPVGPEGDRNGAEGGSVPRIWADHDFFDALGIPILQGRGFRDTDSAGVPDVAVVNSDFAKFYWPGQNPLGKRIRVDDGKVRWVQVVGVAAIKQYEGMMSAPPPKLMFLPAEQNPKQVPMTLYARFAGDLAGRVGVLLTAVREADPVQAVPEVLHWGQHLDEYRRGLELASRVIGAMGVIGVFLALVGLNGLVAFDVSRRTREIGVRMALGARRGSLLRMVLRQGLVLAISGIAGGLLLNYGLDRVVDAFLPSNKNHGEGVAFNFGNAQIAMMVLAVLVLTMLAAYIPARRAASVDPSVALRSE